jgi:hypothetical protein
VEHACVPIAELICALGAHAHMRPLIKVHALEHKRNKRIVLLGMRGKERKVATQAITQLSPAFC